MGQQAAAEAVKVHRQVVVLKHLHLPELELPVDPLRDQPSGDQDHDHRPRLNENAAEKESAPRSTTFNAS